MTSSASAPLARAAEPNITPIIDVMLVLLIISMVMAAPSRALDVVRGAGAERIGLLRERAPPARGPEARR